MGTNTPAPRTSRRQQLALKGPPEERSFGPQVRERKRRGTTKLREGLSVKAGKWNVEPQTDVTLVVRKHICNSWAPWHYFLLAEPVFTWGGGKAKGECGDQTCLPRSRLSLPISLGNFFRNAPTVAANLVAPLLPFWGCWLQTNFTWKLFLSNVYYGNILFTTCVKTIKHEKADLSNVFFFLKDLENILHSYFERFLYLASLNMIWEVNKSKQQTQQKKERSHNADFEPGQNVWVWNTLTQWCIWKCCTFGCETGNSARWVKGFEDG